MDSYDFNKHVRKYWILDPVERVVPSKKKKKQRFKPTLRDLLKETEEENE